MSVILLWEIPESTFLPLARSMRVERGSSHSILTLDSPWGVFEDLHAIDPKEPYVVFIQDGYGNQIAQIDDKDIKRYIRPAESCKVTFDFKNPDGSPGSVRKIQFTQPLDETYSKIICSNYAGHAEMFFTFNARILINIDGLKHSLDCIIPSNQEATWEDLIVNGSWELTEKRGVGP